VGALNCTGNRRHAATGVALTRWPTTAYLSAPSWTAVRPPERHPRLSASSNGNEVPEELPDATLGGYLDTHGRPPGFTGSDGQPYTVSIETERTPDLEAPRLGYLVFPRWAETGLGIVGHVETPVLVRGRKPDVERALAGLPLSRVKRLLDDAIASREDAAETGSPDEAAG
jgi:hypothetical protein